MARSLRHRLGPLDVALDLGTSEQRLFVPGRGFALDPTLDEGPIRRGIVVDAAAAASRLRPRLRVARRFGLLRPRVLACIPSSMPADARAIVDDACASAGATSVSFVVAPLAAATGAGVDVASPYAQAIVDVGEGLTDFAVICDGVVVETEAIDVGMSDLRAASAAEPVIRTIAEFVARAVRSLPVQLGCEIIETRLVLTGGGAALEAVRRRIAEATSLEVGAAASPAHAVIRGAAQMVGAG